MQLFIIEKTLLKISLDNIKYSQPDFYHFSEDSTLLVRESLSFFKSKKQFNYVLDLCAGCAVVGIEFSLSKTVQFIDFIEQQEEFIPHINKNLLNHNIQNANVYNLDFSKCNDYKKYDLILMNPPYFDSAAHRASPNAKKNKCRLITKEKAKQLLQSIEGSLNEKAHLCIVIPKQSFWSELLMSSSLIELERVVRDKVVVLIFKNE